MWERSGCYKTLKAQFRDAIDLTATIALATAVTWDPERGGVLDSEGDSRRTMTKMPPDLLDAVGSFCSLVQFKAGNPGADARHLS